MTKASKSQKPEANLQDQAYLFANVSDAIMASDDRYRLTAWNPAAEKMYGWKQEEVLARPGAEVLRTEFVGIGRSEALRRLTESGEFHGEVIQYRKDGEPILVECKARALKDATGRITGYVSVNRDITERKQTEQQMQLLLTISHKLHETEDYDTALGVALAQICEMTKWDYGEA